MAVTAKFVCSGCRWWHFHPTEGADPDSDQAVGYCRRFPPSRRENGVGAWPIDVDTSGLAAEKDEGSRTTGLAMGGACGLVLGGLLVTS